MGALVMLLLLGGNALSAAAASDRELDQVLALLAQRQHGQTEFTERQYLALLDRPLQSAGVLIYDAPDYLEKRTLTPRPETLIYKRGVLTVRRGRRLYTLNAHSYPQLLPFLESIRATLAGDRAALERVFDLEFAGSTDQWTLGLVPGDKSLLKIVVQIRIEGQRDAVRSIEIRQADGDRSVMVIGTPAGSAAP